MSNVQTRTACGHCGQNHPGGKGRVVNGAAVNPCMRPGRAGGHATNSQNFCGGCFAQRGRTQTVTVPPSAPVSSVAPVVSSGPSAQEYQFDFFRSFTLTPSTAGGLLFDSSEIPRVAELLTWHRSVTLRSFSVQPLITSSSGGQVWLALDHDGAAIDTLDKFSDHDHAQVFSAPVASPATFSLAPAGMQLASRRFANRPINIPAFRLYGWNTYANNVVIRVSFVVRAAQRFRLSPVVSASGGPPPVTLPSPSDNQFVAVPGLANWYLLQIPIRTRLRVHTSGHLEHSMTTSGFTPVTLGGANVQFSRIHGLSVSTDQQGAVLWAAGAGATFSAIVRVDP